MCLTTSFFSFFLFSRAYHRLSGKWEIWLVESGSQVVEIVNPDLGPAVGCNPGCSPLFTSGSESHERTPSSRVLSPAADSCAEPTNSRCRNQEEMILPAPLGRRQEALRPDSSVGAGVLLSSHGPCAQWAAVLLGRTLSPRAVGAQSQSPPRGSDGPFLSRQLCASLAASRR